MGYIQWTILGTIWYNLCQKLSTMPFGEFYPHRKPLRHKNLRQYHKIIMLDGPVRILLYVLYRK